MTAIYSLTSLRSGRVAKNGIREIIGWQNTAGIRGLEKRKWTRISLERGAPHAHRRLLMSFKLPAQFCFEFFFNGAHLVRTIRRAIQLGWTETTNTHFKTHKQPTRRQYERISVGRCRTPV